jgi:hypothetical protein
MCTHLSSLFLPQMHKKTVCVSSYPAHAHARRSSSCCSSLCTFVVGVGVGVGAPFPLLLLSIITLCNVLFVCCPDNKMGGRGREGLRACVRACNGARSSWPPPAFVFVAATLLYTATRQLHSSRVVFHIYITLIYSYTAETNDLQ